MNRHHMRKIIVLLIVSLVACTSQSLEYGDKLVVKASRHWTLPPRTFMSDVNNAMEISMQLPKDLGDNPEWSPDGQWVAFDTQYVNGLYQSQIYLMRSDGSKRMQVTNNNWGSIKPAWSPDGFNIAYEASSKIYLLNVECVLNDEKCDLKPTLLTSGEFPAWSPDGSRLVYIEFGYGLQSDRVLVINADGTGKPVEITPPNSVFCSHPDWFPNKTKIVVACDGNIYTMNNDGSNFLIVGKGGHPIWSPDGNKIVFVSGHDDDLGKPLDIEGSIRSNAIYIMNADGSNIIRLTIKDDESILWFVWMP